MNRSILILLMGLLASVPGFAQNAPASVPARPRRPSLPLRARQSQSITAALGERAKIWGELVPYGKVWRAGANETTALTLSANAPVAGKSLPAGKYALFVIPNETEWTIIINKTVKWGAFSYEPEEDLVRLNVPVTKARAFAEKLTYTIS